MKPSGDKENYLFNKLKTLIENEEKEKKKEDGKISGSEESINEENIKNQ